MTAKDVQLSKTLSWLLRHGAIKEGLSVSAEGYIKVYDILLHRSFCGKYNVSDIERVVANNAKKRFKLRTNNQTKCLEIKANQGHSITQIDNSDLTPILKPIYKTVIHGTYLSKWPQIKDIGLCRMQRRHIHLAKGTYNDPSVVSGLRKDVQVLIYIDLAKALKEGLEFFESENGVILTAGDDKGILEPKYFCKAILVSTGHPVYTQAIDVSRVFSRFGTVTVDKLCSKFAILSFSNCDEATAAYKHNTALSIYGQYLTVKPYKDAAMPSEAPRHQNKQKKPFFKEMHKSEMVDPTKIDFTGDFYQQLDSILAAVRLTQENIQALSSLYTDVEAVMQEQWPGCTAVPFGSITTGLGVKSSDADCFVDIPQIFRIGNPNFVHKAKRILQQYPDKFTDILPIPRANTPIVKFFHKPTSTNCDLTFKTPLGAQNSKLIAFLLSADPRLLPVAVIIKYWAQVQSISGTGKLTNYALTMMLIFYLQQTTVGILPSVEWLQRERANDIIVDHWNTGFMNQRPCLPPTMSKLTISELIGGFFEFYTMFNFEEMVICPFLGIALKKEAFKDPDQLPSAFERYKANIANKFVASLKFTTPICIQDPFEQCHNVASGITIRMAADIKAHLKFATSIYEKEKMNNCGYLLKNLLLQKPKLTRVKTHPDYRVNLFPRIIVTIINPDWKTVVRDLVFVIFEKMLKIKLGKVEEKLNPDTKKEKEKYSGTLTKPVWKRKQYAKQLVQNIEFQAKQELITDEIMKSENTNLNIQFQLLVTYCHDPKSSVISVRLGMGDMNAFKEFGKFFISDMQNWFIELLKPHARPPGKNMGDKIAETLHVLDNDIASQVILSDDETTKST